MAARRQYNSGEGEGAGLLPTAGEGGRFPGEWDAQEQGVRKWIYQNVSNMRRAGVDVEALFSEFVGSFLFLFFSSLCASNSADSGISTAALGVGLALAVLMYATAPSSGGHLNPAISTALFLAGEGQMTTAKWIWYMLMQFGGAISGGLFLRLLLPDTVRFIVILLVCAYVHMRAPQMFSYIYTNFSVLGLFPPVHMRETGLCVCESLRLYFSLMFLALALFVHAVFPPPPLFLE